MNMTDHEIKKSDNTDRYKIAFIQRNIIIVLLCVIAVLLAMIAYRCGCKCSHMQRDPNAEYISPSQDQDSAINADDMQFIVYEIINVNNGKNTDLSIINISDNKVDLIAELYVDNILQYRSGLVPPGMAVYNIKLKTNISIGMHRAKLVYIAYNSDEIEMNRATFDVGVTVNG